MGKNGKFSEIFNTSPVGILFYDKKGNLVDINPSALKIFGVTKLEDLKSLNLFDNPYLASKKEKLINEGIIKFQSPIDFNNIRKMGFYNSTGSGIGYLDYVISVTDFGYLVQVQDITDRKQSEDALRESEDLLRTIFEHAAFGMALGDMEGRVIESNPALERILGYSKDELHLKPFSEFTHPDDVMKEWSLIEDVLSGKSDHYEIEKRYIHKDNSIIWVRLVGSLTMDPDGKPLHGIALIEDITERKKSEKALKESEEKLKSLFETMPIGLSVLDKKRKILYENYALGKILKLTKEELLKGEYIKRRYIRQDMTEFPFDEFPSVKAFNEQKPVYDSEIGVLKEDNSIIWTNVSAIPLPFTDWNILVVTSDITERKILEEELRQIRDDLELKVQKRTAEINQKNKLLDGINTIFRAIITNLNEEEFGKTRLAVCEELTGSEFSFIGGINEKGTFDSIAVSERGWQACNMVKTQGPESVNDNIIRGIRGRALKEKNVLIFNDPTNNPYWSGLPDGHYPITSFLGAPLIYRDKVIGLIALANKKEGYSQEDIKMMEIITFAITESLMHYKTSEQLEENHNVLKDTVNELKRSNEELQQFAYVSSHDLQEPLRTIASFTQLLEHRYKGKLDSDADEFMDYIVEASVRMKQMIQDLLEYSRVATKGGEFKPVNCEILFNDVKNGLINLIEENNVKITHDFLPTVMADEYQLYRVFQNLIINAIRFKKPDVPPKIHISAQKEENEYAFSVSDNAIGIEEQYFNRIFTIFQRLHTRDEYQGTGIGLSISKKDY